MADSGDVATVERVSARALSAREFIERFAEPGRPVVLLDIVPEWPSFREWRGADGKAKYASLAAEFRGAQGPVVDCDASSEEQSWDVGDYFDWAAACADEDQASAAASTVAKWYLKDWHFVHACEMLGKQVPYKAPDYLAAPLHDWLNLHLDRVAAGVDDYRFCYAGIKHTRTPLHHDVLFSYSWSANICGRKHWIFYPPEVSDRLVNARGDAASSAAPCKRPVRWEQDFPKLAEAWKNRLEAVQEAGELMFVPSGWYHEVENLSFAISINHNWLNAANASAVWRFLQSELKSVEDKIGDLRGTFDSELDFAAHCQVLMKANCGLDLAGWLALLTAAAEEALRCLGLAAGSSSEDSWVVCWVSDRLLEVAQDSLSCRAVHDSEGLQEAASRLSAALQPLQEQRNSEIDSTTVRQP